MIQSGSALDGTVEVQFRDMAVRGRIAIALDDSNAALLINDIVAKAAPLLQFIALFIVEPGVECVVTFQSK